MEHIGELIIFGPDLFFELLGPGLEVFLIWTQPLGWVEPLHRTKFGLFFIHLATSTSPHVVVINLALELH